MISISKAMVMAAGLGTRMRPLTDTIPKPLVKVAGVSLIDRTLDWLGDSGINEVVVNTHYKAELLEKHLHYRVFPSVQISREEVLLETGGGVRKAMPLLGEAPFFVANSDVICVDGKTPSLQRMQRFWNDDTMDILLLLHSTSDAVGYAGAGDFFLDAHGRVSRRGTALRAPYVFTGVQLIHPRIFAHAPAQEVFSLNVLYDHVLAVNPQRLFAIVHDGSWLHIGDPEGITKAEAFLTNR